MEKDRFIEVSGDDRDLEGLIESVEKRFGVKPSDGLEEFAEEDSRVRYDDDSDAMAHAFERGLMMYVRGFVDSKVDGTLRVLEESE